MRTISGTVAWGMLVVALACWVGVGYFAQSVVSLRSAQANALAALEKKFLEHAAVLRLHALVRDTKDARAQLEGIADNGVIATLELIEAVGRDTGVELQISQAGPGALEAESRTRSLAFVVQGEGTFARVMQTIALFESLPAPSAIDSVQLVYVPDNDASTKARGDRWGAVIRLHFLTTSDLSS